MNAPLPAALRPFDHGRDASDEIDPHGPSRPTRTARRRRRGQRDSDRLVHNHATERWMVSYADFITLLFAFFVVMYAISSVNEGRYRVLSGALSVAFSQAAATAAGGDAPPPPAPAPVAPSTTAAATVAPPTTTVPAVVEHVDAPPVPAPPLPAPAPPVDPVERAELEKTARRMQQMTQLATRMDEHLKTLVRDGQVQVTRGARGISIEINAAVLFDPAKADLKPASFEALRSLAEVLSGFVEPLQVEGHSDDVPIATREFRSNWELSAARAASVGRFLIGAGIAPGRIGIAGYAEFRPLTANASADGRARNRRVTILVLSADDTRPKEGGADPAAETAAPKPAEPSI